MKNHIFKAIITGTMLLPFESYSQAYRVLSNDVLVNVQSGLIRNHISDEAEKKHILNMQKDAGIEILFDVKLRKTSNRYYVMTCTLGGSYDPGCSFYKNRVDDENNFIISFWALNVNINGDGCIYSSGHTNSYFDIHRKFCEDSEGNIKEIEQPLFYAGIHTVPLVPVKLYNSPNKQEVIAEIFPGDVIEVVASINRSFDKKKYPGDETFLVKTKNNILGWYIFEHDNDLPKLQDISGYANPTHLKDLFFAGD